MEILSAVQVRDADRFTIEHQPVLSVDLMERAAGKCFEWFRINVPVHTSIHIFCGQGNNGGDGLALARMLILSGYSVNVSIIHFKNTVSKDFEINFDRLKTIPNIFITELQEESELPFLHSETLLVDAIFGTGFKGKVSGMAARVIRYLNESHLQVVSIDLPSGINSDETSLLTGYEIIKATHTLTFQYLKLAFLVEENAPFIGKVTVLDIGLLNEALNSMIIKNHLIDFQKIKTLFKPKREFSHKGNYGHALLFSGGYGKMGAAVLAARGYLKSGAGLLTLLVPEHQMEVIQTSVPEAMAMGYAETNDQLPDLKPYDVIGAGPGIGTGPITFEYIKQLLSHSQTPLVLDADALNLISQHRGLLQHIPENTVLTPHPGEFRRLAGDWKNDFDKLELQRQFAQTHQVYLILKGKNTSIALPDGTIWFNSTGNAGMSKGGSGDILTGLLTGLLSSGYSPLETCLLGTWLHGHAGDLASESLTQEGMNASDIINFLPLAWKSVTGS